MSTWPVIQVYTLYSLVFTLVYCGAAVFVIDTMHERKLHYKYKRLNRIGGGNFLFTFNKYIKTKKIRRKSRRKNNYLKFQQQKEGQCPQFVKTNSFGLWFLISFTSGYRCVASDIFRRNQPH